MLKTRLNLSEKLILASLIASVGLGRWGSYLGLPAINLFLIDILFFSGVFFGFLGLGRRFRGSVYFSYSILLFILFQLIRDSEVNFILAARDLLPFIYLLCVPACAYALRDTPEVVIVKSLRFAATLNLAWFLPSSLGLLAPISISPISPIPLFTERADQSGIAMGIGVLAWSAFPSLRLKSNPTLIGLCVLAAAVGRSRAGLFTCLLALFLHFFFKEKLHIQSKRRERVVALMTFSLAVCFLFFGSQSSLFSDGNSSLARAGIVGNNQESVEGGRSTSRARYMAATTLISWVEANNLQIFGAGAGREIILESGAVVYLSGNSDVRAPHNWFIGLYARFGILGLLYWCTLLGQVLVLGRKEVGQLQQTLKAIILIICFCSSLGVIMESPFGALPIAIASAMYIRRST